MARPFLIGAIDFGTAYSGWAFSFKHEYDKDPTKATIKSWNAGAGALVTSKTPTYLLLQPDGKTVEAFGYDAENKYRELFDHGEHTSYFFFKRFKMKLYKKLGKGIDRAMALEDEMGKKLKAIDVFAMSISYLKEDMISAVQSRLTAKLLEQDVHWVLTVPAIWSDSAKQFMREAAEKAGIATSRLTIALEPEAASLYCRHLPMDVQNDADTKGVSISQLKIGTKYMVLDAGGGTIDITVHEVKSNFTLRELRAGSGGDWGGVMVDEAFEDFLVGLVGKQVFNRFKAEELEDWIYLQCEFESKKREKITERDERIVLRFPVSLIEIFESENCKSFTESLRLSTYANTVELKRDKIKIAKCVFSGLFERSVKKTADHVWMLMRGDNMTDVKIILMVGGYSECVLLQRGLQNALPGIQFVIPDGAASAVLIGALMFGHNPDSISERILKHTYGVAVSRPFQRGFHREGKRFVCDDGHRCDGLFSKYVEKGQNVRVGETQVRKKRVTIYKNQADVYFNMFASEETDPVYVDDAGCTKIGSFKIKLQSPDDKPGRPIWISMKFGGAEIIVEAEDGKTGNKIVSAVDFLD